MTNSFIFETDVAAKKLYITRQFNAPIQKVWRAWTEPALLEKWIVMKDWKAVTRTMDFTVGGVWLYAMISPEGQQHWVYNQFTAIESGTAMSTTVMFCDSEGNPMVDGPKSYRETKFSSIDGNITRVDMVVTFDEESILKMFVGGGFKEGIAATFNILDDVLTGG